MQEKRTIVALDFDGTLCEHRFPDIGREVNASGTWFTKLGKISPSPKGAFLLPECCTHCHGDQLYPWARP